MAPQTPQKKTKPSPLSLGKLHENDETNESGPAPNLTPRRSARFWAQEREKATLDAEYVERTAKMYCRGCAANKHKIPADLEAMKAHLSDDDPTGLAYRHERPDDIRGFQGLCLPVRRPQKQPKYLVLRSKRRLPTTSRNLKWSPTKSSKRTSTSSKHAYVESSPACGGNGGNSGRCGQRSESPQMFDQSIALVSGTSNRLSGSTLVSALSSSSDSGLDRDGEIALDEDANYIDKYFKYTRSGFYGDSNFDFLFGSKESKNATAAMAASDSGSSDGSEIAPRSLDSTDVEEVKGAGGAAAAGEWVSKA